ncbi:MAG: divalent metal cation transporter [bacterium]|nr:divalent metal cation transporter [bacterium]
MAKAPLLKRISKLFGPGFLTGASDNDPTSVATYSQTGAMFGLGQLWTAAFALPFMVAIQEMSGRIGLVTCSGLSGVIKRHYPSSVLYGAVSLLFVANVYTIGANLGAMASSIQLFVPMPFMYLLLGITIGPMLLEIFIPYPTYARFLKYLTLLLLSYFVTALIVTKDWGAVFSSLITPQFIWDKAFIFNLAAIFGTTICPYLFFWQSDQEVEEEISRHRVCAVGTASNKKMRELRWDTTVGMVFSQMVTVFIIVTAAATFGAHGITNIETATDAALALKPLAGEFASLLFTLGIVGTGLLAVPVLAGSAAYAISQALGWKASLGKTFRQAPGFYAVIIISTLVGLFANLGPVNPIKMLYYAAVLNGIIAPILMVLILLIGNNRKIMGDKVNSFRSNFFGITITVFMATIALLLAWHYLVV